ncbi:hypothetical protein [Bosea sp. 124]|uniref:hypothetical protein n=1 Tax=Bosea sp. 124 TaxID=2135642 RepID=UPI000D427A3F|nr:hypothetical protein [Bosea sp. 124]PTM39242.1 hypothetical protein C8D03_0720 [Bosea sp. 124]
MREPFQRRVVHGYPSDKFETDISRNFPNGTPVMVTLESFEGIAAGDTIIETHFEYVSERLVKVAEKSVIHQ